MKKLKQTPAQKFRLPNRKRGTPSARRRWHFLPVWQQFGYDSQAHMDLERWGEKMCWFIVNKIGGRKKKRAHAALELLKALKAKQQ